MSAPPTASPPTTGERDARPDSATLVAAVLGFFVITLDALVVTAALPDIRNDLGGVITGLQ
jgi:DHA2 family methylenomycin A resistance protein-like MFS transporter